MVWPSSPPFFSAGGLPRGNLLQWWKADGTLTKDGANLVSRWNDMSGHGNDWVAGAGAEVLWVANQINGLPIVRGTSGGSVKFLSCPAFLTDGVTTAAELFLVLKSNRGQGVDNVGLCAYGKYKPGGVTYQAYPNDADKIMEQFGRSASAITTAAAYTATRSFGIYRVKVTATSYDMWLNGVSVFSFSGAVATGWNQGGTTNSTFYLFTEQGTNRCLADNAEGLVYSPTCPDPAAAMLYLQHKYAL